MLRVWTGNKWELARSAPKPIRRGRSKGKYWIMIFTGNPDHPQGLKRIKVTEDELREFNPADSTPQTGTPNLEPEVPTKARTLQQQVKHAVDFGNGLQQNTLFKKAEQRSLF